MENKQINSDGRTDMAKKFLNDSLSLLIQADISSADFSDLITRIKLNIDEALKLSSSPSETDLLSVSLNSASSILYETDPEVVKVLVELLESSLAKAIEHFDALEIAAESSAGGEAPEGEKVKPETVKDKNAEREILLTFIDECGEHIQAAEESLMKLEEDPSRLDSLNDVFRSFHTIKGSAHFLKFKNISEFAHEAENFLSEIREGKVNFNKTNLELAFRAIDELKLLVAEVKANGKDSKSPDYQRLMSAFKKGGTEGTEAETASAASQVVSVPLTAEELAKKVIGDLEHISNSLMQAETDDLKTFINLKKSLDSVAKDCKDEVAVSVIEAASLQLDEIITNAGDDCFQIVSVASAMIESCITHLEGRISDQKPKAAAAAAKAVSKPKAVPVAEKIEKTAVESAVEVVAVEDAPLIEVSFEFEPDSIDREMFLTFIDECLEHIQASEEALLNLENNLEDITSINTVFRAFHTVKGSSSFLGLAGVTELAHHAESLLVKIRDKEIPYNKSFADICLRSVDILKTLIVSLKTGDYKKPDNYDDLLRLLMSPELKKGIVPQYAAAPKVKQVSSAAAPVITAAVSLKSPVESSADAPSVKIIENAPQASASTVTAPVKPPVEAHEAKKPAVSSNDEEESTVRVKIARIDKLIDMVGELVISHSMVAQDDAMVNGANHLLAKKVMQSGKIIRELQDLSMTMRMIPFRATFQKMARAVRDISGKNGKAIDFITSGKETEVDRNLVDIINDALMHMVRNSVDHGIEPSEVRKQAGKPEKGRVVLSAFHSGGNVVIEIKDDGKGLDRPKIVKKAIEKGLIKSDENMSDSDVFNLVFLPGFSTADQITDISGRGVGMDVVKTSIESLRGRIDITSMPGNGCCFSIKVPLTLAVTDGMLIKVGSQRYIIPTANIYLTFRPKIEDIFTMAGRGEMVMLHQKMIPVFRLHKIFNISGAVENPWESLFVVIDDGDNKHCAVLVDELLGQQQIVAKPLGSALGKIEGISGGAILGDGKVGLIIDTKEIVSIARQMAGVQIKQIA